MTPGVRYPIPLPAKQRWKSDRRKYGKEGSSEESARGLNAAGGRPSGEKDEYEGQEVLLERFIYSNPAEGVPAGELQTERVLPEGILPKGVLTGRYRGRRYRGGCCRPGAASAGRGNAGGRSAPRGRYTTGRLDTQDLCYLKINPVPLRLHYAY